MAQSPYPVDICMNQYGGIGDEFITSMLRFGGPILALELDPCGKKLLLMGRLARKLNIWM